MLATMARWSDDHDAKAGDFISPSSVKESTPKSWQTRCTSFDGPVRNARSQDRRPIGLHIAPEPPAYRDRVERDCQENEIASSRALRRFLKHAEVIGDAQAESAAADNSLNEIDGDDLPAQVERAISRLIGRST